MRTVQRIALSLCLSFSVTANAQITSTQKTTYKVDPLPRDLEIQLALSALPTHLRSDATVYVLNPDMGFEVARKGTNGFQAFVARTGDDAMQGAWPLTKYRRTFSTRSHLMVRAKANMRVFFDIAEMQAKGTQPGELKRLIPECYKTGYKAPERAGCSYMLSMTGVQGARIFGAGHYVVADNPEAVADLLER